MHIQFKSVKLSNFLSLGDSVEVDLDDRGFVLVEGKNKVITDGAKSNGAGKSSIFEGIIWVLTGETIRGTKDIVNNKIDQGAKGELIFYVDSKKYEIYRFKEDINYGTNLKIIVDGEDMSGKGVRDSERILKEYLPDITAQLLGSVIVLGQGLPQRFTNNTPSGRKELLEKLSKSDYMIMDLKEKLQIRKVEVSTIKHDLDKHIVALNNTININNNLIVDLSEKISKNHLENYEISYIIGVEEEKISQYKKELEELEIAILDLDKNIGKTSVEKSPYQEQLIDLGKDTSVLTYRVNQLRSDIREAQEVKTHCHACKRPFDDVVVLDTTDKEQEINELREQLSDKQAKQNKLNETITKIESSIGELNLTINKHKSRVAELKRLIEQSNMKRDNIKTEYEQYLTKLNLWEDQIKKAKEDIEFNKKELEIKENEFKDIHQKEEAVQKLTTLTSRDFRGYLLEGVIYYLEDRARFYCKHLFNSTNFNFKLDSNQIFVGYDGKAYENLSGGEKQKVDIIVQLSLRDMLMTMLNFSCNILVLDEIFDNLDETGCDSLINLITQELKDVQSIFTITHHADIAIPYDDKIIVVKDEQGITAIGV